MTEIVRFPEKGGGVNAAAEEQSRSHLFAATVARLAAASTQEYERQRSKEAKTLQCRPGVLDRLVENVRQKIARARSEYNFEEELPITPGSMISVDGDPVFAAAQMRFSKRSEWSGGRYDAGRLYTICVVPDGEASVVVAWQPDV
jgi:hypothetical protein